MDEPARRQLPSAVVGPDEFFPAVANSPVGAYANGFGTHALHEDADIKRAYDKHNSGFIWVEVLYRATLQSEAIIRRALYFHREK